MDSDKVVVHALDLGSTRIKAGRYRSGTLEELYSVQTPPLLGEDPIRQFDPRGYLAAAHRALDKLSSLKDEQVHVGIASQRSSFLFWDKDSGDPVTPVISWRDRRAVAWCDANRGKEPVIRMITGLPLSPHYVGPKLAAMRESSPMLWSHIRAGRILWGTLETYLIWLWTGGRVHITDFTMAARTLMADIHDGTWCADLLALYGIPLPILPVIGPSAGREIELKGGSLLSAEIADQAGSLLAATGRETNTALVNLGTGGFVLVPTGSEAIRRESYLCGPVLSMSDETLYALEGTMNGVGSALDRYKGEATTLPIDDPTPEAFCLPDQTGVGAPHWKPTQSFSLSESARDLPQTDQRRIVLEGIVFRVREIVDDLIPGFSIERICVSGGLTQDPFLGIALSACLQRPIELLEQQEGTLIGVARLAAGEALQPGGSTAIFEPEEEGSYLPEKYTRWKHWLQGLWS